MVRTLAMVGGHVARTVSAHDRARRPPSGLAGAAADAGAMIGFTATGLTLLLSA